MVRQDAMTSEQAMLSRALVCALLVSVCGLVAGCDLDREPLGHPIEYRTPYPAPKLWAVVPLRNESGVTTVDPAGLADHLTRQLQQVDGIDVLPVNRVIEAMAVTEVQQIDTPAAAMALMRMLNVDGLLVGTVTAWDPYEPPKIGMLVQLYAQRTVDDEPMMDPRLLTRAATPGGDGIDRQPRSQPVAQASAYLDAANATVLRRLQKYAHGRVPPNSPAGWRRYVLNMDLYSEFACHEMMRRLFSAEWKRLTADRQVKLKTETGQP